MIGRCWRMAAAMGLLAAALPRMAASAGADAAGAGPSVASREASTAGFARAVEGYEAGRPADAKRELLALLDEGFVHPAVLYNLGNAAYRLEDWVTAAYAYEWAARLEADRDLAHNLELVRRHLPGDRLPVESTVAAQRVADVLRRVPLRLALWTLVAAWTLGWLVLALRLTGRLSGFTWLGVTLLLLSVPPAVVAAAHVARARTPAEGIVQVPEVDVRSGPGHDYALLFTLHAGTVVKQLGERADWRHVAIAGGPDGWAEASSVAVFGEPATLRR